MNDTTLPDTVLPILVPHAASQDGILTVTFQIANQQYGLPVTLVREIVRLPALVPLARASDR